MSGTKFSLPRPHPSRAIVTGCGLAKKDQADGQATVRPPSRHVTDFVVIEPIVSAGSGMPRR